jgi:hypothetical protein
MGPITERTRMDEQDRTMPEQGAEPSYDRRRGPRRAGPASLAGDERRRYERRKTPGVSALLQDILKSRVDADATEDKT